MKQITLTNTDDISKYQEIICKSAEKAKLKFSNVLNKSSGVEYLAAIKFDQIGFDPLDPERKLNLVEQVNQTFTYLASLRAVEHLFKAHRDITSYRLNLGTRKGLDIESSDGYLAAEVFAATHPKSNNKLEKDINKVKSTAARYKYIFFSCPDIPEGFFEYKNVKEVVIRSLGR